MPTPIDPQADPSPETTESFEDMLSQYERDHSRAGQANRQLNGTVIAISADTVFVDIGYKTEGVLLLSLFAGEKQTVSVGDKLSVSVKGRNPEGYYDLSRLRVEQPKDWNAMEKAFAEKAVVTGNVTAVVKGGLTVDIGVRAFMPASRSGVRDAAEMEGLVGQEIHCRITRLDVATEDVVVDRRVVSEEEESATRKRRYSEVSTGDILNGTVRSLTDYGAFVDLGGLDGLLHVGEIAWTRVNKAEDVLSVGQQLDVRVIKVDPETQRISLSVKQLQPHPWEAVADRYGLGDRVRGTITRLTDFGAFLEIEPGIEGLIHISAMSWGKKVRKPSDLLKVGDTADAVILAINIAEHRLSLGLKQALGDPWVEMADRLSPGAVVKGEVMSFTSFGAFLHLAEGVQGMVHISEIAADRRLNHPSDVLRIGESVEAKVLEFDREKRQLRLSIKQMAPTGLDEFFAEHRTGDTVSGRIVSLEGAHAHVELGEGVFGSCPLDSSSTQQQPASTGSLDLSSLSSMLQAHWKTGGAATIDRRKSQPTPGQIRSFIITSLNRDPSEVELQLAD